MGSQGGAGGRVGRTLVEDQGRGVDDDSCVEHLQGAKRLLKPAKLQKERMGVGGGGPHTQQMHKHPLWLVYKGSRVVSPSQARLLACRSHSFYSSVPKDLEVPNLTLLGGWGSPKGSPRWSVCGDPCGREALSSLPISASLILASFRQDHPLKGREGFFGEWERRMPTASLPQSSALTVAMMYWTVPHSRTSLENRSSRYCQGKREKEELQLKPSQGQTF